MSDYEKNYKRLLDEVNLYYPFIFEKIVDWYPSGHMEITVKTNEGKKFAYHGMLHTIRLLHDPDDDSEYIDEEQWRHEFAMKLVKKMSLTNLLQEDLVELTGISRVTISKYINGKATPSTYNLCKLARALGCSVTELLEIQ